MSVLSNVVAVVLFVVAALWLSVGVLGLVGRLPRNRWVGLRADETMRSAETFRIANRIAGPGTIAAGAIAAVGGLLTVGISSAWSPLFGGVALVAGVIIVGLVGGLGVRAAAALPAEDTSGGGCGCCCGDEVHDTSAHAEDGAHADHSSTAAGPCGGPETAGVSADGAHDCASCTLRNACTREPSQA